MSEPDLFQLARLLSDSSRAYIIQTLMDGEFHTVNELAKFAQIKQHTASYHLKKMAAANIVTLEKQGRFHYYRLVSEETAKLFEEMSSMIPQQPIRYLSQKAEAQRMYQARTCYDHLAGKLGVKIMNYLIQQGFLSYVEGQLNVTEVGEAFFEEKGILVDELKKQKRVYCRACIDWSERKHHVAGSIGKGILELFLERHWITKTPNSRAIFITKEGEKELKDNWGIEV